MSSTVPVSFVRQYRNMLYTLVQQKGSRLRGMCRNESQKGKSASYETIGEIAAVQKTGRHSDTPLIETPHGRRTVTMKDWVAADLIDNEDKIRMLIDPGSHYTKIQMYAHGRAMDDAILAAISGSAYAGEDGETAVVLPNAQKIAAVSGAAGANLNVEALRRAQRIIDQSDADPELPRYFAFNAKARESLLGQTEVASSDYNTVKALVAGQIDTFLGFKFVRTERLGVQSGSLSFHTTSGEAGTGSGNAANYVKCLAWVEDGVLFSLGQDFEARVDPRPDKNYAKQYYSRSSFGATRMEEKKVVEVLVAQ